VKIEVKQVDDNYTWLYNENQYLNVELSDLYLRHSVPKGVISHSFGGIDITHVCAPHIHILSGHIYRSTNNGIITD